MANQRKHKRHLCAVPVDGKEGSPFSNLRVADLSKGGVGLVSSKRIPVNKEIFVELDFQEGGQPVFVLGKVKWIKPIKNTSNYRVGLFFKDVVKGSKAGLNDYFVSQVAA